MIKVVLLPQQRVYKKYGLCQPPSESRPGSVWEAGPADFVPCAAKTISVELPCSQWIRVTVTQVMLRRWGCRAPLHPLCRPSDCWRSQLLPPSAGVEATTSLQHPRLTHITTCIRSCSTHLLTSFPSDVFSVLVSFIAGGHTRSELPAAAPSLFSLV